jgi:hypothetical protein
MLTGGSVEPEAPRSQAVFTHEGGNVEVHILASLLFTTFRTLQLRRNIKLRHSSEWKQVKYLVCLGSLQNLFVEYTSGVLCLEE